MGMFDPTSEDFEDFFKRTVSVDGTSCQVQLYHWLEGSSAVRHEVECFLLVCDEALAASFDLAGANYDRILRAREADSFPAVLVAQHNGLSASPDKRLADIAARHSLPLVRVDMTQKRPSTELFEEAVRAIRRWEERPPPSAKAKKKQPFLRGLFGGRGDKGAKSSSPEPSPTTSSTSIASRASASTASSASPPVAPHAPPSATSDRLEDLRKQQLQLQTALTKKENARGCEEVSNALRDLVRHLDSVEALSTSGLLSPSAAKATSRDATAEVARTADAIANAVPLVFEGARVSAFSVRDNLRELESLARVCSDACVSVAASLRSTESRGMLIRAARDVLSQVAAALADIARELGAVGAWHAHMNEEAEVKAACARLTSVLRDVREAAEEVVPESRGAPSTPSVAVNAEANASASVLSSLETKAEGALKTATDAAAAIQAMIETVRREAADARRATEEQLRALSARMQAQCDEQLTRLDTAHAKNASEIATRLRELEREASSSAAPPASLQRQIDELRRRQSVLEDEYNARREAIAQVRHIESNARLSRFYRSVLVKSQEFFLACKALDSGMVSRTENTTRDHVAKGIELAGDFIPFPAASTLATVLSKAVAFAADRREERRAANVADMVGTFREIDEVTEGFALELTRRYEQQVLALKKDGAQDLGECAVKYMISHISFIDAGERALVDLLVASVTSVRLRNGVACIGPVKVPNLRHRAIACDHASDWTDEGIFVRTGIRTPDGRYFGGECGEVRPEKYGYRLGSAEEARELGYRETKGPVESGLASLTTAVLSKATRQRVKDFVSEEARGKEERELLRRNQAHLQSQLESLQASMQGQLERLQSSSSLGTSSPPPQSPRTLTLNELLADMMRRFGIAPDTPEHAELVAEIGKIRAAYGALATTSHLKTKGIPANIDCGVADLLRDYL